MASDDEGPPTKKARFGFNEHVEVIVGPREKHFVVHKRKILPRSPFFEAACSKRWAPSDQNRGVITVELPDDDPDIFNHYLQCLYEGNTGLSDLAYMDEMEEYELRAHYPGWVKVLILADKLGDIKTANTIVDEMISFAANFDSVPNGESISLICASTTASSPYRLLFVDFFVYTANETEIKASLLDEDGAPKDFVCAALMEKTRIAAENYEYTCAALYQGTRLSRNRCRYHQHDSSRPRCGPSCKHGGSK